MKVGKTTAVQDAGRMVMIYATNMVPHPLIIPVGVTPEVRKQMIDKAVEEYEKLRQAEAAKNGELD